MKIYIGADHAGVKLKEKIRKYLEREKIVFEDLGSFSAKSEDDYPDYASKVAEKVSSDGEGSFGVLICGSGIGMEIAANKVKGVRASTIYDSYSAKKSREDNNANVICLRVRGVSDVKNLDLLKLFLKTKFSQKERHRRRIDKIAKLERRK
jgi:ribose 5-phosphate isomerase B